MNIAIITAEIPFPCNSGGRIYTWERIKQLKKNGNNIYLYSFIDKDEEVDLETILKYCSSVETYERNTDKIDIIKNIYKPYSAFSRFSKQLKVNLSKDIKQYNIDIVIIDMPQLAYNIYNVNIPIICSQHNIEYMAFFDIAKKSSNFFKKLAFYFEGVKLKYFEDKLYKKNIISAFTFISKDDCSYFINKYNNPNTLVVPMGYNYIKVEKNFDNKIIVFTGKMNYEPNIEGVLWFSRKVFPKIKAKYKECRFYIVGKDPSESVRNLEKIEGIIVTGTVDDVNEYLDKASLVVIPLLSGGGVKIKLLEALGRRNLVVSTIKGIEGTEFKNNIHLIVEDGSQQFSQKCIDILSNSKKYEYLLKNSFELINDKYNWDNIGRLYNDFIFNYCNKVKS